MNPATLQQLLQRLRDGETTVAETTEALRQLPFQKIGEQARVDHHRELRLGVPEVVYGAGKSAEQIASIMSALDVDGAGALATRVSPEKAAIALQLLGRGRHNELAKTITLDPAEPRSGGVGDVGVVCAGTSDIFVAEEAAETLAFLGNETRRINDVGVAGLHRLLDVVPQLQECQALIVVAGMEGALPTAIAGLVGRPIVAVPTSVGYGVAAGGFVALAGMLSSCAPGVTVVNIDNGFGAAVAASRINRVGT